jgi:hypothetical protein
MIVIYWTLVFRDQNSHGAMTAWDRVLPGNGWIELLLTINGVRALMLLMLMFCLKIAQTTTPSLSLFPTTRKQFGSVEDSFDTNPIGRNVRIMEL